MRELRTYAETRCRTDNKVVHYSRLRMRIYQIQVHFEMQFAKRPGNFSQSRGRSLYPDKVFGVLVLVESRYLSARKRTNERTDREPAANESVSLIPGPGTER